MRDLFTSGRLSSKRKRGRSLELERIDSKTNLYTEENCALACYLCNNHKSDVITKDEHKAYFAKPIRRYVEDLHRKQGKVTDASTDFLYLADSLPKKHPMFYASMARLLDESEIRHGLLPHTKDIWARDYMPIQITADLFVQFLYNPSYLQSAKWLKTISDTDGICAEIGIKLVKSNLKIDGGNVVRNANKAIMCDRVFSENPDVPERQLISELRELLQVEQVVIIPTHPQDFTGHADGMVRFLNKDTVLINDLSKEKPEFQRTFRMALHNAGLDWREIPYNPYGNIKFSQANGIYINYIQIKDVIILPTFGLAEDQKTVNLFEELFPSYAVKTIDSNEIAEHGGILNCISWNIKIKEG
ncbi:agmatine deiminase family protein [Rufibacter latericius]|uniref:agmatine deiminase family protein n=1 Tax=Rufibacter latericius TaxID=2487040 RepID=UPI001403D202|nr:agmatine deiminase family protein [Rufibacter latericius]